MNIVSLSELASKYFLTVKVYIFSELVKILFFFLIL